GKELIETRQQVVALDDGDPVVGEAGPGEDVAGPVGTGGRVHAASVRDDLQPRLGAEQGTEPFEDVEEITGEAGLRVALLLQGEDWHGEFGEVLQGEVVELAVLGEKDGGVHVVAPETTAVADPHHSRHGRVSSGFCRPAAIIESGNASCKCPARPPERSGGPGTSADR